MKRTLKELLQGTEYCCQRGSEDLAVSGLAYDTKQVTAGCIFFCIRGFSTDGHAFAAEAVKKGAVALVTDRDLTEKAGDDVTVIRVKDSRRALARMSAAWFGYPARELITIGITGTKGKTTTAYMIHAILTEAGIKTGLMGTIEIIDGEGACPTGNTTPESYVVQETFRRMADQGCRCVVMEVSSQGLMLGRVEGIFFDYGIFTNLEPDHIGPKEHEDFAAYCACKAKLFRQCRHGILNADDPHLQKILKGHCCTVETFGIQKEAGWMGRQIRCEQKEGRLTVSFLAEKKGEAGFEAMIGIPGRFNVSNALAAIAVCRKFFVSGERIQAALADLRVRGRMEPVKVPGDYALFVDYAHNAMSLEGMLTTIRDYHPKRLICMFGCGGNRSKIRRYEMGEVSARLSDLTVITTDNPRDEDPLAIMEDIRTGVNRAKGAYVMIEDRREAIRYCLSQARQGDVIVLAGKGHENYQEIQGKKYPMEERELVREALLDLSFEKESDIMDRKRDCQ